MSQQAEEALLRARMEARHQGFREVGPGHILLGLYKSAGNASAILKRLDAMPDPAFIQRRESLSGILRSETAVVARVLPLTWDAHKLMASASREAADRDSAYITTEHILLAICNSSLSEYLGNVDQIRQELQASIPPDVIALGIHEITLSDKIAKVRGSLAEAMNALTRLEIELKSWDS